MSSQKFIVDGGLSIPANTKLELQGTELDASGAELNKLSGVTASTDEFNLLDGVTASTTELNYVDITTLGTAQASKVMTWASDSTWTAAGGTCADLGTITTVDINGGTINGSTIAESDVTVGAGKTLNVSAGTLTLADDQISGDKVEGGTINAITINTMSGVLADGVTATTQAGTDDSTKVATTAFVQSLVGGSDLDFKVGDTTYALDLDSERLDFAGTANEIELTSSEDGTTGHVTMTIGLPDQIRPQELVVGDSTDKTFDASTSDAHLIMNGDGYSGFMTTDGSDMMIGHNSAARGFLIKTDETTRISIAHSTAADPHLITMSNNVDIEGHNGSDAGLKLGSTLVTATAAELNKLDGATVSTAEINYLDIASLGTAAASKALVADSNAEINANAITFTDLGAVTTVDINGGTIDGATIATSDVTVGSGKTLDVSGGTLTTSAAQKEAILQGLDADMDPDFGDNVLTAESFTSDVATGTAPFTVSSTTMVANLNVESLSGMTVIDEDDMSSDSATRIPTQQSVKKYVDDQLGATDLDFKVGDTTYALDLDSERLDYAGTANEIALSSSEDGTTGHVTMTIGLPDDVTIGQDLTITRHIDVDGTANLDDVDIDGNTQADGTVTVGATGGSGYDVKFFGGTLNSKYMLWDASQDKLDLDGSLDVSGASTFSDEINASASLDVSDHNGSDAGLKLGSTLVTATAAEINLLDGVTATTTELNYVDVTTLGFAEGSKALTVSADPTPKVTLGAVEIEGSFFDINGGTIDGATIATSDVTVGSGKTLDVSGGTLTLADDQISGDKVEGGTINAITINTMSGSLANGVTATTQANTDDSTNVATTAFVQSLVGGTDLDFKVGNTTYALDLDSERLDYAGTDNEIELSSSEDGTTGHVTMTIGLPDDVTIGNDLTITRNIDVDGTANLDAVDIDGATQIDGTVTVGSDGSGYNVTMHSSTTGNSLAWNGLSLTLAGDSDLSVSGDSTFTGNATFNGTVNLASGDMQGTADDMAIQSGTVSDYTHTASSGNMAVQAENELVLESSVRINSDFAITATGGGVSDTAFSFDGAAFHSAKVHVRISDGSDVTAKELLVVCDALGANPKFVEYGTVNSAASEMTNTWSVDASGGTISVKCVGAASDTIKGSYELLKD